MGTAGEVFTKLVLPLSGAVIAWIALGLSRRGAKRTEYEQRLADEFRANEAEKAASEERRLEIKQRMDEQSAVNDRLYAENLRLNTENVALRASRDAAEVRADTSLARIRSDWESRWSRQMERCRQVTDTLASAIRHLSTFVPPDNPDGVRASKAAIDQLDEHNAVDHPPTD